MLKRVLLILLVAAVLLGAAALGVFGYIKFRADQRVAEYELTYEEAGELLQASRPNEALSLLQTHFKPSLADTDLKKWPARMVQAAIESRSYGHLEHLVENHPRTLFVNESAALWWARAQIHRGLWSLSETLMARWPEESRKQPNRWKLLEADYFLRENDTERARSILESWSSAGHDEVNRQLRLAMLAGGDNEAIAEALNAAYIAMPTSSDLRATAAQFLERNGQLALARREYIAAFLLAPDNPFHGDQLAHFYLRTLALPQAIQTWRQTYERTADPRAWWNVWFWERVTLERGEPLEAVAGNWWGSLTSNLSQTQRAAFLPKQFYGSDTPPILAKSEGYHWLLVFECLRLGDEARALEILETMPMDAVPIAEDLHSLMTALLDWRVRGDWPRDVALKRGQLNHRFYRFLEQYRPTSGPSEVELHGPLERFLLSKNAPAALVLANGWLSAADRLFSDAFSSEPFLTSEELDWIPFAYCKMIARVEGAALALEAAERFSGDVTVRGFSAELMLSLGQIEDGLARLSEVAQDSGPAGFRASYLSALAMLERRDFSGIDKLMAARTELAESVSGRELQARAAQLQGEQQKALEIYTSLGDSSLEACVYRYRAALLSSDFETARDMVETLLRLAPNEPKFHQWMRELEKRNG